MSSETPDFFAKSCYPAQVPPLLSATSSTLLHVVTQERRFSTTNALEIWEAHLILILCGCSSGQFVESMVLFFVLGLVVVPDYRYISFCFDSDFIMVYCSLANQGEP